MACNNDCGSRLALLLLQEDRERLHVLDGSTTQAQEAAARLILELLESSIVRGHEALVAEMVKVPAALLLGEFLQLWTAAAGKPNQNHQINQSGPIPVSNTTTPVGNAF